MHAFDRQTDGPTDRILIARLRRGVCILQRRNNVGHVFRDTVHIAYLHFSQIKVNEVMKISIDTTH